VIADRVLAGDLAFLDERELLDYVERQRWFGSKALEVTHARPIVASVLRTEPPLFVSALVEIRFHAGTHDLYQLLLGFRPAEDEWADEVISEVDGWTVYGALRDPTLARELVQLMRAATTLTVDDGRVEFRPVDLSGFEADLSDPRPIGVEQSNSSVVFGDTLILKAYRRLEAGVNPELELLRFLTVRRFPNIASLAGWYAYSGRVLEATLGILQEFVPDAIDGWELALAELGRDPEAFLSRLHRLGEVTGELHSTLASDSTDPDFAPEEPSTEALAILTATVDEEIESIFLDLPEHAEAVAPIRGRGEEVREQLRLISHVGALGRVIRHHGDYHLGQVLWNGEDWIVLDFEGEPARSLSERRQKRSPLRDVAGMLRSFAYAVSAAELRGMDVAEDWEGRARSEFLDGYFATVDRSIIPPSRDATEKLLAVFELEKAVYELRYELNNRPDWARIPVAGILRLLETPVR
jgi:trehalose synthase-fused probable maltokinase